MILWIFVVYMVGVGFTSLVPQALWPHADASFRPESCAEGIRALREELHDPPIGERSSDALQGREARAASTDFTWLERWDSRYESLQSHCTDAHLTEADRDAYAALGQLRQQRELSLRRAVRDQAPLEREIEAYLHPRLHPSEPSPEEHSPEQNAQDHD